MDPFRFALALGPLALYLLAVGIINLRRRPVVVSGGRDSAALALALAGLIVIGPVELFLPRAVLAYYGPVAWSMIGTMYLLIAAMWVLTQQPRLTIYNATQESVRVALAEVLPRLDPTVVWASDSAYLPHRDINFQLDAVPPLRNVTLTSIGEKQSLANWRELELQLAAALDRRASAPNPLGGALAIVGLVLIFMVGSRWLGNPREVNESMRQMFRLPEPYTRGVPRSERPAADEPPAASPTGA